MSVELANRRVLAGFRFVSAVDGQPVPGPLEVTAVTSETLAHQPVTAPVHLAANRRGIQVLYSLPGLADYTRQFDPPNPPPAARELNLRVVDRSGRFLPAVFAVTLPRSLDSTRVDGGYSPDSVFEPVVLALLPGPNAPVADSWAVLRIHLFHEVPATPPNGSFERRPLPGALVRIYADEAPPRRVLGRGLTEWRSWTGRPPAAVAEALVAVAGIPAAAWSNQPGGAVLTQNQAVRLEVRVDGLSDFSRPATIPVLSRLEPVPPAGLPAEVRVAELGTSRSLRTGLRETLRLLLDRNDDLTLI